MNSTTEDAPGSARILVVEDEPALRRILARFLDEHGYETHSAEDSAAALSIAAALEGPIDLIVCDVMLGKERGPDVVAQLRSLHPDARALLISGFVGKDVAHLDGIPLLEKPFSPSELLAEVARLLADPEGTPERD